MNFKSFSEFLKNTANCDREFLHEEDIYNLIPSIYAFANSSGGFIIFYGTMPELNISNVNFEIQEFNESEPDENENKIFIIQVYPVEYYKRPLIFNNKVYRRVEGINLISNNISRLHMAGINTSFYKSDEIIKSAVLNFEDVNNFREAVISNNPEFKFYSEKEFFKRSFICSGKYLTQAGFLMFGHDSININVEIILNINKNITSLRAGNLWQGFYDMLPKLILKLSNNCANAVREIFLNALIHSDYNYYDYYAGHENKIKIEIYNEENENLNNPVIKIINPGLVMSFNENENVCRNLRLMKIFKLLTKNKNKNNNNKESGMKIIKDYDQNFKYELDMLNFYTIAKLKLESIEDEKIILPAPKIL